MSYPDPVGRPIVMAFNGMASTGHPLATQTAVRVLESGGNAMDAAVAASAVLSVVDPAASGLGGEVFYTYFNSRTGTLHSLTGGGKAPGSRDLSALRAGVPETGPLTPAVPGLVRGWDDAITLFGTRGLDELLAPALAYAENGFPVSPRLAGAFQRKASELAQCESAIELYQPSGNWPVSGEKLVLRDLARTLEIIRRKGADAFYAGEIVERITSALAAEGGLLEQSDFEAHRSAIGEPLVGSYRGYQIAVPPPPTMSPLLLQQLKLLENSGVQPKGWGDPDWVHLQIEAKKASFSDFERYLTDPLFMSVSPLSLFVDDYVQERGRLISMDHARVYDAGLIGSKDVGTTYLTVADGAGNVVSWIQSVFNAFGSCWVAPGTGFVLNNRLLGFSSTPDHINSLEQGKRTAHTLIAPLVLRDGRPCLSLGTPGDYGQTQSNLQMLTNFIDLGFDIQQMIEAPRWRSYEGLKVLVESRFAQATINELKARGHEIEVVAPWVDIMGGAQAIHFNERSGCLEGAADPRREGYAAGW